MWASRLLTQSSRAFTTGTEDSYAGWMDVPVWFLATVEDRGLPVDNQRMFVEGAREAGADVTLREIGSGHSPMLSRVDETVSILLEASEAFTWACMQSTQG